MAHAILAIVAILGIGIGALSPDAFYGLMQEDGWAEWATFLAFMSASVLGVRLWLRAPRRIDRVAASLLVAFTVFVAGEEISWGHRLFAFEPPDVFLEHNYQQEMNLHNLLKNILDTRWMVAIVAVVYGIALPFLSPMKRLAPFAPLAPVKSWAPHFAVIAGLEVFYPFELVGELAELLLGLAFIADIGERLGRASAAPRWLALSVQAGSLAAALALMPLIEIVLYGDQQTNVDTVKRELELLRGDLEREGVVRKKLFGKRRVHKRLFTAVRSKYLRLGTDSTFLEGQKSPAEKGGDRKDRKGYFLDVWSQPYWVSFAKKERRLVVYSFGPNRRRDFDGDLTDAGDDLTVTISLR
jgi:hypothetical protein